MKTKLTVLLSVLGLALLAGLAIAATSAQPAPAPATTGPDGPRDEFRARLVEKLGLSADQQKQIDDLRARQRTELQALNDNNALAPEARREQGRAIVENYRAQMHAVLTPDQQKQADEWRARWALNPHGPGPGPRFGPEARRGPAMQRPPANPLAIVAMADRIKDRMAENLQLTEEQRDKLEHLGRAYRAEQRELAKKHLDEMRAVLTPEQQKKAEEMKQHFRHGSGAQPGPDGHPPLVGLDDVPAGVMMAGLDFAPVGLPDEMSADLPDNN